MLPPVALLSPVNPEDFTWFNDHEQLLGVHLVHLLATQLPVDSKMNQTGQ